MSTFGAASEKQLATCSPNIQRLFREVIKHRDCTIVCGFRNQADQDKAFAEGKSKLKWPNGKHNKQPSKAVDVMSYPIDWNDRERQAHFAGFVLGIAAPLGIKVRWGGDWNQNGKTKDESFLDMPHFEEIE